MRRPAEIAPSQGREWMPVLARLAGGAGGAVVVGTITGTVVVGATVVVGFTVVVVGPTVVVVSGGAVVVVGAKVVVVSTG